MQCSATPDHRHLGGWKFEESAEGRRGGGCETKDKALALAVGLTDGLTVLSCCRGGGGSGIAGSATTGGHAIAAEIDDGGKNTWV